MTANNEDVNEDVKSERKPAPRERKLEGKVPLFTEMPRRRVLGTPDSPGPIAPGS
jgi:hypothetical protein